MVIDSHWFEFGIVINCFDCFLDWILNQRNTIVLLNLGFLQNLVIVKLLIIIKYSGTHSISVVDLIKNSLNLNHWSREELSLSQSLISSLQTEWTQLGFPIWPARNYGMTQYNFWFDWLNPTGLTHLSRPGCCLKRGWSLTGLSLCGSLGVDCMLIMLTVYVEWVFVD